MKESKACYVCGAPATDVHHVYPAANRKKSTKYGFVVNLCRGCHDDLHFHNPQNYLWLKQKYQRIFEETHTREQFIAEFGKSYLTD